MVKYRCEQVGCHAQALFYCSCQEKTAFACEAHLAAHLGIDRRHTLQQIHKTLDLQDARAVQQTQRWLDQALEVSVTKELAKLCKQVDRYSKHLEAAQANTSARLLQMNLERNTQTEYLKELLTLGRDTLDSSLHSDLSISCWMSQKLGDQVLKSNYDSLINDLLQETKCLGRHSSRLFKQGQHLDSVQNFEAAAEMYARSAEVQLHFGLTEDRVRSLSSLGLAYNNMGQYEQALATLQEAEDLSQKFRLLEDHADICYTTGLVYTNRGIYSEAVTAYLKCIQDYKRCNLQDELAAALQELAVVYDRAGNTAKACAAYEELLETCGKQVSKEQLITPYCELISLLTNSNQLDKARELQTQLESLFG